MAKILCNYFGLSMAAEGKSEFVGRQAAAFLGYVQQDAERCAENCGRAEDLSDAPEEIKREILRNDEELRRRKQTAPGVEHDVVAIYDNAGIPSIMHRFRRVTNKELFGGSDAVHPAFIIGGEVYDEIYISVYENTMINGKPYSLPLQEPVTNITMEDFAQACFSKGEGWHCLTAAEWGLLADTSLKLGTLPHGNTNCSHWHGDDKEQGIIIEDSYKTLTGSGPATWTHDHTASGVHDLCGNICLTERRVRQLRDEGVIVEARPGLYELQPTVARYIKYLGGAGKESLNTERMKLTAEKRKAAEMDNDLRRGDLHSTQDIEKGIQTMCLNIRSRFLAMPAKLSPTLAAMDGNQAAIFDEMKKAIDETLEELSDYRVAFAVEDTADERTEEK